MLKLIIRNKKLNVQGHERKEENGTLLHLIVEGRRGRIKSGGQRFSFKILK